MASVRSNVLDPASIEKLSYGSNGLKGIIASPYVFGAAFLASLGGFSFGYDQGVISLILTMDQFHARFPETAPGHPSQGFYVGFMTGMLELGAFLGCLVFPWFADRYSRKWGLSMAVVWFCIGAIIQTAAQDYGMLVAGRTIGGVGVGTLALGAPLYISEIAPPNLRGTLLVLEQFSIVVGAIIAYWLTYGTDVIQSEWAFRLPFLLQMVPALGVGLGIHIFPYSPRWLCMRDRSEESLQSLVNLRRLPADDHRSGHSERLYEGVMATYVDSSWKSQNGWICSLHDTGEGRSSLLLYLSSSNSQARINAFVYYAPTLFSALGQSKDMSLILSGMINICQLVGASITTVYLDSMGRRPVAIWGGAVMGIPHAILAGLVATFNSSWSSHDGPAWFAVALVYIYVLMYGLTYGPLGWTLPSEVYPNAIRAKGVGLAVSVNWIANFIIGVSVPPMIQGIGYGTYIFFACFCFLAAAFSWFFVPETANLTLEQIDRLFKDNTGAEEAVIREQIANEVLRQ
ncbi:MFS glucose transporter mfs1, partial [Pseudocercospora fuligena]